MDNKPSYFTPEFERYLKSKRFKKLKKEYLKEDRKQELKRK